MPTPALRKKLDSSLTPDPRGYAYGLPPEVLRQTANRLGVAALMYAAGYVLSYGPMRFIPHMHDTVHPHSLILQDVFAVGFILLSLGVYFLARSRRLSPSRLLDLGLFFEVVAAAGIEVGWALDPGPIPPAGLSWTCVWIVVFPLLVPSTFGKMLLATIASAAMLPFMYLIGVARGAPPPGPEFLLHPILPLAICVGIAVVGYRVVHRLRTDATRAQRLGSYRLVERLGVGGMGEVWRAEHEMLARPAAIKLIRPESLGSRDEGGKRELLARFEREAQATALLESPHTVTLYDFGVTEDGTFYYVMELLEGLDFATLVERFGPVPPERAIFLLRQACESLAEAHRGGLVHRDVKPANLYACRLGLHHDFVKVLDFGLVKSSAGTAETQLTVTQGAVGTPAFMAPELLTGGKGPDGRADLYALGCVAYWLLTGNLVFTGKTPLEVALAHLNAIPEPPSRRGEIPVPADLDALVLACLAKRPEDRPATAEELEARLGALPSAAGWGTQKASRWWELHLPDVSGATVPL